MENGRFVVGNLWVHGTNVELTWICPIWWRFLFAVLANKSEVVDSKLFRGKLRIYKNEETDFLVKIGFIFGIPKLSTNYCFITSLYRYWQEQYLLAHHMAALCLHYFGVIMVMLTQIEKNSLIKLIKIAVSEVGN